MCNTSYPLGTYLVILTLDSLDTFLLRKDRQLLNESLGQQDERNIDRTSRVYHSGIEVLPFCTCVTIGGALLSFEGSVSQESDPELDFSHPYSILTGGQTTLPQR